MTRTDAILAAVRDELERRREDIESDDSLSSVSLIIRLDARSDRPYLVIYRTEAQRRLTAACVSV